MECTGRITDSFFNLGTGKYNITFEVNERASVGVALEKIKDCEKLSIKAVKYRNKRSLDANAYAWVLMQKLAEETNTDKWAIYLECLQRYSGAFTHVIVKEAAAERMKELYRTCVDLGEVEVNGQTGIQLQVYYGSSTFNTKEMAVFLDGIISECEEHGIETMPPDELERMKATWRNG